MYVSIGWLYVLYIYGSFTRRISMHKSLNGKKLMYISIGWLHDLNAIVFYNRTSTYNLSCLVCFKCFLLASVCYISYGGFQTKVYKIGGCYSVLTTKKGKVGSLRKLSE
jgi:hypothetical protein